MRMLNAIFIHHGYGLLVCLSRWILIHEVVRPVQSFNNGSFPSIDMATTSYLPNQERRGTALQLGLQSCVSGQILPVLAKTAFGVFQVTRTNFTEENLINLHCRRQSWLIQHFSDQFMDQWPLIKNFSTSMACFRIRVLCDDWRGVRYEIVTSLRFRTSTILLDWTAVVYEIVTSQEIDWKR